MKDTKICSTCGFDFTALKGFSDCPKCHIFISSTPTEGLGKSIYSEIQKFMQSEREKYSEAVEKFMKEKVGYWRILPDFLLKKVFVLETHRHPHELVHYSILKNKITGKQYTLILEGKIGNS